MAASQVPWGVAALEGKVTAPAWKVKPPLRQGRRYGHHSESAPGSVLGYQVPANKVTVKVEDGWVTLTAPWTGTSSAAPPKPTSATSRV